MFSRFLSSISIAALASGCALLGGVQVERVATSVQKPSNVALYVAVRDSKRPVDGLSLENFAILENEQQLPAEQSQLTLLDRELAATHRVLVLIDMSTATDAPTRQLTARAVGGFVARVREKQAVTVYAFDGSEALTLIGEYPRAAEAALEELAAVSAFTPRDPSRNLHGAIATATRELDARLMQGQKPLRIGTLVVFTRGPDLAGRIDPKALRDLQKQSSHHVLTIGIGKAPGDQYLENIGRAGVVRAQDASTIAIAFEEAATQVNALHDMYYLLSYCSPARAGKRRMRLEVSFTTPEGDQKRGSTYDQFDAAGFGPGCDPRTPPRFVLSGEAPAQLETTTTPPSRSPSAAPAGKPADAPNERDERQTTDQPAEDVIVPPPEKPGYSPAH